MPNKLGGDCDESHPAVSDSANTVQWFDDWSTGARLSNLSGCTRSTSKREERLEVHPIYIGSNSDDKDRYLINALMEEAIASSQLEGAVTTRRVAKRMLREGRKPRSKAERMILNNYNAILKIRDCQYDKLTPASA